MPEEMTWNEMMKDFHALKEKMKLNQDINYKSENNNKERNKYYHIENLELDSKKISRRINELNKAKDLDQRRKDYDKEKSLLNGKPVSISYTSGSPTYGWKSLDNEKIDKEILKRTLNGENVKMAIETLKNFNADEIDAKIGVIQDFNNSPEILKKYTGFYESKGKFDPADKNAKEYEKFFSKYEIIERPEFDKNSAMSALVIGNKETREVEIIFGASQNPFNMFSGGEKGKRARQDWIQNDFLSAAITPDTQKAARDFTRKVKETYKNGHNGYGKLTMVNGHSKAGGEAIHSVSYVQGLKCFAIDPAPIVSCGPYITQNNLLTVVPGMGHGFLSTSEKNVGTEFHLLKIKPTVKNSQTYKTLALPVEQGSKGNHFPDNEMTVDRLREYQKYAVQVEKKLQERQKINENENIR